MKPELRDFFAAMDRWFAHAESTEEMVAGLQTQDPDWQPRAQRLEVYARFVDGHVTGTLDAIYPLCRAVLGDADWSELQRAHLDQRPARDFEINSSAEAFIALLEARAAEARVPDFLPHLARFEWADFAVYRDPQATPASPQRCALNPTVVVLEHPYALCAFARSTLHPGDRPEAAEETAVLWRHPTRLCTMFRPADPELLLAMKVALEDLSVADAAAAADLAPERIGAILAAQREDGLLL